VRFGALVAVVMVAAYGAGLGSYAWHSPGAPAPDPQQSPAFRPFLETWSILHAEYAGDLPGEQQLTYAAIRGVLSEVGDPYTVLVDPVPHQQQTEQLQGHYGGIGVTLSRDEDGAVRLDPLAGSPAAQAGVQLDDVLLAVDRVPVSTTEAIDAIAERLHGEVGTEVRLTVRRGARPPFEIAAVRAEIAIPSVTARVMREDPTVGYLQIAFFSATTGEEVKQAVQALRAQGATRLIVDLRNNNGGLVQSAVDVASQFLDKGVVLYEVTRGNVDTFYPVQPGGVATDLPLIVLVNGSTASAAEAVAGALQDSGRARLVGDHTYGKGSVQLVHQLSDGSSLHVTAARWLTPKRRSIDGRGLTPDVAISITQADHDAGNDVQLWRALAELP
jgi:carboxyl-terminal processing protease